MIISGIYAITNTRNGKIYIGSTINFENRWGHHRDDLRHGHHHNSHLQHAWNKYGEKAFEFGVLEYLDNLDELVKAEQFWMDIYREENRELYNIGECAKVPFRGQAHTEESIQRMRAAQKGKNLSEEHKRKIGISSKGRKHSEEDIQKIREARRNQYPQPMQDHKQSKFTRQRISDAQRDVKRGPMSSETRLKISKSLIGHPVSLETRQRISEGNLGKSLSKETKLKLREANLGKKLSEETKQKISTSLMGRNCTSYEHQARGEKQGSAVLTEDLVRRLRHRYETEKISVAKLSEEEGVNPSTAYDVVSYRSWKHVE